VSSKKRAPAPIVKRYFLLPDTHAPYHHPVAFGCALRVVAAGGYDGVVCLGDFADFAAVSAHPKDPSRLLPFDAEVKGVNAALDQLDAACRAGGVREKLYLEGNHETRLARYVLAMAPELRTFVDWRDMLHLDKRRWQMTPYKESIQLGDLRLSHDFGRAGVNAARESCRDMGHSVAFGHTHRMQVHYQGQLDGGRHVGATLGWLGDPEAIDYRHKDAIRRDSIHGFGDVCVVDDNHFWLQAVPIVGGRAVVDGVVY
jgi:predicted phosphodiesterase